MEYLTFRLEKEPEWKRIQAMFNPNSYTITKSVAWSPNTGSTDPAATDRRTNAPPQRFDGGGSRQLSFELFFDVTERADEDADVRVETAQFVKMTRIVPALQRPPWVEISWGVGRKGVDDLPFTGLLANLSQRFTLFHASGRPLRALLNVTFVEFLNLKDDQRETDPDVSTRTTRRGDTLAIIAEQVYGDVSRWREIALANGIERPLQLQAGFKLTLPKLQVGSRLTLPKQSGRELTVPKVRAGFKLVSTKR
jgi:nucleoid-associated protein YgaU